jgi:hypothetical protein
MLILLSFFLQLSLWASCELKDPNKKLVSLSGPVTVLFRELGILSKLEGISVFHPVSSKAFRGVVYPGGIFLSSKALQELKGKVVFFDESRELKKILVSEKKIRQLEMKTRGLLPHEVSQEVVKIVSPFLKNCEKDLRGFVALTLKKENAIVASLRAPMEVIFFVGDLVIVQDGMVRFLSEKQMIKTYPSTLAYVSWSAKIMNQLKLYKKIHLKDSANSLVQGFEKNADGGWTATYPGILIPGFSQVEGFAYLFLKEGMHFVNP